MRYVPMRFLRLAVVVLLIAVVAAAAFWAGRVALEPPEDPLAEVAEPVRHTVDVGTVGRSLSFTAIAEWPVRPAGRQAGPAVVTSVEIETGAVAVPGDVLFTTSLRPVVVARGSVPMFRSLSLQDVGEDVAQLQEMLIELAFFDGEVDGVFGAGTRNAVREWQDSLGVDGTGVVEMGDLVFVESLPARLVFSETLIPGGRLADGEVVVFSVSERPNFEIHLSPEQADLVPLSAEVVVSYAEGAWEARVEQAVEIGPGQLDLILTSPDGGSVCGDVCAEWVSLTGTTNFRAEIVVIPETTGPVVPVGAISTDAANSPSVTLTDGTLMPVTIVEAANGIAVVDGIDVGTEILLLVEE